MTDVLGSDPKLFWNKDSAREYEKNNGIRKTQEIMTERGMELLKPEKGKVFLDIGCGTGFSSVSLRDSGFNVFGVDISRYMVDIARGKGLDVLVGDFKKLPFIEKSFDYIISISSLQWITGKDKYEIKDKYEMFASEVYRVLRNKGKCFIQFFPGTEGEMDIALRSFRKSGFDGFLVKDEFEDRRKNKDYILLTKGGKI